jgi:hypothetical protein
LKVVRNKHQYDFKIKIKNEYVTIACLQPWLLGEKYNLYFYYYGEEYEAGTYACSHFNGNVSITVCRKENELLRDFLVRVEHMILKKLYAIGTSILEEIKNIDDSDLESWEKRKKVRI